MAQSKVAAVQNPMPSRVLQQLFEGDRSVQNQAVDVLTNGLAVLAKASEASRWIDGTGKWNPGVQRNPELDARQLFQLTNVRRAFLEILDAIEAGKNFASEESWEAGKSLGATGALDYRKLSSLGEKDPLFATLYQVDATNDRHAAILNEALGILSAAALELRITEAELLRLPSVRARFLELLNEIPTSPFFGKELDWRDKDFELWSKWKFGEADSLRKAAFTITEKTPFTRLTPDSKLTTASGAKANFWEYGIHEGQIAIKGTITDAGMCAWDLNGRAFGDDRSSDLRAPA